MRRLSTRRTFLTTLGTATTLAFAGCSSVTRSDRGDGSPPTKAPSSTTTVSRTETMKTEGPTTTTKTPTPANMSGPRGEVIEDFEGSVRSRWDVITGTYSVEKRDPRGGQSVVLHGRNNGTGETAETNAVGIYRSFGESGGLDLRNHDLTMAVKFEKPVDGYVGVEFVTPSSNSLTSLHYIPIELDGWTRFDLGYTAKDGQPTLKNVQELRIVVNTPEDPITVALDDIRKIPKPKKGKVMFQFDDSHITAFTEAFPRLKQRNWAGGVAIIPGSINSTENMTIDHMHEMRDAGWDMMSHPHPSVAKPLPQLPAEQQERLIRQSKQFLVRKGFEKGARHVVAPFGRVGKKTIEIMQKYHETNYLFGGSPSNAKHPSNMYAISRVFGTAPMKALRPLLDLAERYNQMLILEYHEIGGNTGTSVSMEHFENVLNYVGTKDMDVVSPSQFLDS